MDTGVGISYTRTSMNRMKMTEKARAMPFTKFFRFNEISPLRNRLHLLYHGVAAVLTLFLSEKPG